MFKNILLPLDVSDRHTEAVDTAADLVGTGGGELTLFHVIEVISGVTMDEEKDFYRRLEKTARAHLDKVGERLKSRGVAWRAATRSARGLRAEAIFFGAAACSGRGRRVGPSARCGVSRRTAGGDKGRKG